MRAPDPTGLEVSAEAREAFVAIVDSAPEDPAGALATLALAPRLRREVEELVAAYLRTRRLESELMGAEGEISVALAEVGREIVPAASRAIPSRIGAYEVLETISVGPRSAVVRARQLDPVEREVAVKIAFEDACDAETGPRVAARAELERRILATLEHPNVARLYDSGIDALGRPYIAMELVRGGMLTSWSRAGGRGLHERLRVFLGAVEALRHAHSLGVLHRDVKPENVLVQLIDGEAHCRLIDFGIALGLPGAKEREALLRERGGLDADAIAGTLRSMSPESLDPARPRFDVRSDVFGLGLVLFEVVTGESPRPAAREGLARTIAAAVQGEVPRLRSRDRDVPRALDAIVARACAPAPESRYQSVAELHEDLSRFLRGDEVLADPDGPVRRVGRMLRRRPFAAAAGGGALLIAVLGLALKHGEDRQVRDALARGTALVDEARIVREIAGSALRRESLGLEAMDVARGALVLRPDEIGLLELRADAVEEVVLPRLARADHRSQRTRDLVDELVTLRERIAVEGARDAQALERLSRALAYQLDTTRGTPEFDAVEARQVALDEELVRAHPEIERFTDNLCWTLQRASDHAWTRGEPERSLALMRSAARLGDELLARSPDRATSYLTGSMTSTCAAVVALLADDLEQAHVAARTGVGRAVEFLSREPDSVTGAAQVLKSAVLEARILLELGRTAECGRCLDRALAIAGGNVREDLDRFLDGRPLVDLLALRFEAALASGDAVAARRTLLALEEEIERARGLPRSETHWIDPSPDPQVLRARLAVLEGDRGRATEIAIGLLASDGEEAARLASRGFLALAHDLERDHGLPDAIAAWRVAERDRLRSAVAGLGCGDARGRDPRAIGMAGALVELLRAEGLASEAEDVIERVRACTGASIGAALGHRALERAARRGSTSRNEP